MFNLLNNALIEFKYVKVKNNVERNTFLHSLLIVLSKRSPLIIQFESPLAFTFCVVFLMTFKFVVFIFGSMSRVFQKYKPRKKVVCSKDQTMYSYVF